MKKYILSSCATMLALVSIAQTPEDAIRFSGTNPKGTARSMAIGGAMGSLGGDLQAGFINPAGLGMYKTSEFVLSPGFQFLKNNGDFRGSSADAKLNKFSFGTSGFVFGYNDRYSKSTSKAFSIAVTRTADFNNKVSYKGLNDFSSFSEQYAEEFANSGLPVDVNLQQANLSLGTKLALYNYVIDTVKMNNAYEVIGLPMREHLLQGTPFLVSQQKDITTKGGITEIALGFASNKEDKFYIGGSIGMPIMNYTRITRFREADETGNTNNSFNYATYYEEYNSKGVGINGKLGIIFKPADQWRIGTAIHTPSFYGIREDVYGKMVRDLENFPQDNNINAGRIDSADSYTIYGDGNKGGEVKYTVASPWKLIASASYVIRETEDTRLQKGFVSADIEYVTYGSNRFNSSNGGYYDNTDEQQYYDDLNGLVKDYYKGAFNFRLGGEMKFHTLMARAGLAYYGNPYTDAALKSNRMQVSGGLGYRDHGIFIDLTYVHNITDGVDFPYRLGDKANTFADVSGTNGNVMLTFGVKF